MAKGRLLTGREAKRAWFAAHPEYREKTKDEIAKAMARDGIISPLTVWWDISWPDGFGRRPPRRKGEMK